MTPLYLCYCINQFRNKGLYYKILSKYSSILNKWPNLDIATLNIKTIFNNTNHSNIF